MANQPLAFAELMAGGVLVLAGVSGSSIGEVIKGTFTWPPKSLVSTSTPGTSTSTSDGTNLTPSSTTVTPSGSNGAYSLKDLEQLWVNAGGPAAVAPVAGAIALAESSGIAGNVQQGQPYSTTGWGLWQITPGNSEPGIAVDNGLLNAQSNATAAVAKYNAAINQGLDGFSPWTTYTSGAYKTFLGG